MTEDSTEEQKIVSAVAERLGFFFSNANVRSDYFMRQKLLKSEDGFIPIEVLLRFNSIKNHTTDPAVVVKAAKTLTDQLVVNKDETAIGRVVKFSLAQMDDNIPLSLYVSNIPLKETTTQGGKTQSRYAVSVADLRPLFEPYGKVTLVKFRFKQPEDADKHRSGRKIKWNVPVGAGFIEYETSEELNKAAADLCTLKDGQAVTPAKKLELGGNTLEVMTLKEKLAAKKKKEQEEKEKGNDTKEDGEKESSKRQHDKVEKDEKEDEKEPEEFSIDWKPRCVISIKGLGDGCDREALRAMVAEFLGITDEEVKEKNIYADYSRGQTTGAIRFGEPSEDIVKIAEKLNSGDILIGGSKVESAKVLDGEEETKYWQDFIDFKTKQMRHRREERAAHKKKRFRRGGRD